MGKNKKIAILSGKGGTGKTLLAVNFSSLEKGSTYVDLDVEEPNGYLFFKPIIQEVESVKVKIPEVNYDLCIGCKKCVNFCKFNALAYTNKLKLFEGLCHSCGGCVEICPVKALTEKEKIVGEVRIGKSENTSVLTGEINIGEASGIPIIKKIYNKINDYKGYIFLDCAPGSSCLVMESISNADYCVLVAEPTIFGLHNLKMVYELVNILKKPFGVVLNKCTKLQNPSEEFCKKNSVDILGKIPFDKNLGKTNSNSEIVVNIDEKYRKMFSDILQNIKKEVSK